MRILQVITSLLTGGAEKLIVDISARLKNYGHDVDVVVFNGERTPFLDDLNKTGCRVIKFSEKGSVYNPFYILKLKNILSEYDIIHTHNTSSQLFTAIANLFVGKPIVTTEHNTSNRRRNHMLWKPMDRWMYAQYDHIICISDKAEENLRGYLGRCATSMSIIYNGIDVERFHSAKEMDNLKSNRFVIVMVSAFRRQKDQRTLIDAMSLLSDDDYELWLVGDGDLRLDMESYVKQNGIKQQVCFWGNRNDIPNILHSADVVCMSSHYEGLSLSSLEGMSVGKPFVATDVDGLREVTQGYGILVPHQDAEALAKVIRQLHDDREYYRQVADACYERAKQFDINRMVEAYNNVYKTMVSSPKSDIV
ncbi:MAG: glycosyltransferase [Prevotella sp.]|nr:glycosyltransferase [Prevotella sp.]MDY6131323.1 glycosyltransferase [Prevotella sp.]